jgi:FtsH-binding integral membrane protein
MESDGPAIEAMGALTLYLDFINLFLSLLHLFGDRKE